MSSAWLLPEHIADVLPAQARHIEELRRGLLDVARSFGCELVMPPLMEHIEARHPAIKVFSLPSVDHPQWGRHIELGVKGEGPAVELAYAELMVCLQSFDLQMGPELVR